MMRGFVLVAKLLSACASPSPQYLTAPRQTISVQGWDMDVFRRGDRAQIIRTNTAWGASKQDMQIRGIIAVEEITGCRVDRRSPTGDAVILNVKLICD